jgi:hypothetical protein
MENFYGPIVIGFCQDAQRRKLAFFMQIFFLRESSAENGWLSNCFIEKREDKQYK